MGVLATAVVDIVPDLTSLRAGLNRAKLDLSKFASEAKVLGRFPLGEGFNLRTFGLIAGVGGLGAAMVDAAKKSSALGESLSKAKVVFGKDSQSILTNTDRLADQFGVVRREALDAASAFGLMGRAAGLSTEEQAKMASELVNLGIDLASFHDISRQEAFTKLRAGLAGEAEPLRPLGIMLSEDAVKAEALALGLTTVNRQLTDQEKIRARISIIQRAAGPAIGDAERTASSTANILRKAMGDLENFTTSLGTELEPALVSAIRLAEELGKALSKSLTGQKGAFGEAASDLNRAIGELRDMNAVITSNWSTLEKIKGVGQVLFKPAGYPEAGTFADRLRGIGVAKPGPTAAEIREKQIAGTLEDIETARRRAMPPSLEELAKGELTPGKTRAEKQSEEEDRILRAHMRRIQAEEDRALSDRLGGVARGPQGAAAIQRDLANRIIEKFSGPNLLNTIRNFTAGPIPALMGAGIGGGALATGLQAAQAALEKAGPAAFRERIPQPSRMFADPDDFAREAITGVLTEDPTKKEALEVQKQAAKDLEQIKEDVREGIRNIGRGFRGLFPRG